MLKPDLVGHKFNRLTVIAEAGRRKHGHVLWLCRCECGKETKLSTSDLNWGGTVSCGCYNRSIAGSNFFRHGLRQTPLGNVFNGMISRCYKKTNRMYPRYGGRGICVCEGLRSSPVGLLVLVGQPVKGQMLDRKNNDGNYSCGQCAECQSKGWTMNLRWATRTEQNRNKCSNCLVTVGGQTKCMAEWSEILGVPYKKLYYEWERGRWPKEEPIGV